MNGQPNLLHVYWIDLIELLAALIFLVAFKVILVWAMAKVAGVLQDDEDREASAASPPAKLSSGMQSYRWVLAILLIVNGLIQIRPILVGVRSGTLLAQYTGFLTKDQMATGFAHFWALHSVWMNIWSVVLQLVLGVSLLLFHRLVVIRSIVALIGLFSLMSWVFVQNFGDFMTTTPSFFAGVPTASILILLLSTLAFFPDTDWSNGKTVRRLSILSIAYWIVLVVVQWLPEDGYWSSRGYNSLEHTIGSNLLQGLRSGLVHGLIAVPILSTIVIGLIALALAAFSLFVAFRRPNYSWWWFGATVCAAFIEWVLSQGLGAGNLFIFPAGAGLVVVAISGLQCLSRRTEEVLKAN